MKMGGMCEVLEEWELAHFARWRNGLGHRCSRCGIAAGQAATPRTTSLRISRAFAPH